MADLAPPIRSGKKSNRELAARALCRFHGRPENDLFEGRPLWQSYLPQADAVLNAIGWREAGAGDGSAR